MRSSVAVSAENARLRIQSYGQLLAVDLHTWRVRCASAGAASVLGLPPQPLTGAALPELVGPELLHPWVQSLGWGGARRVPQRFLTQRVDPRGRRLDVIVQSLGELLLLELLPRRRAALAVDDTPWLEQLAGRLLAADGDAARQPAIADEMRLLAQHCECIVWRPEARGRLLAPYWKAPAHHRRELDGTRCDPAGLSRHPARALQVRVVADLGDAGREIEGDSCINDALERLHLAQARSGERRLLEALGARSAVLAARWDGDRLLSLLTAHSPDAVHPGLEAVSAIERLLLLDSLLARVRQGS